MHGIVEFLSGINILSLASDTRVLVGAAILFVLAAIFRWKAVLLLIFCAGGLIAVFRLSKLGETRLVLDIHLLTFSLGTFLVALIVIYFLFIKGD